MPQRCTVLIAAPERLPALKRRIATRGVELLTFSDTEVPRALEVITTRHPSVVALDRLFATTPRGAALINRITADASLTQSEIRVLSHGRAFKRMSPRKRSGPGRPAVRVAKATTTAALSSQPLDQRGTRRAHRFKIAGPAGVIVEGHAVTLVDLSTLGAQILSATILRPKQRVRMALADDHGAVQFNASVVWATFEIPPSSGPRYRAGIEFLEADPAAVDAYCGRHKE